MLITSLLENTTKRKDIGVEHGLSLYIEIGKHKILFDMGQTDLFHKNSLVLEKSIEDVEFAVLSHGHYDHGGGLDTFLKVNKSAPVYINKDAFLPHYNKDKKYIGLDRSLCDNKRLIYTDDEYKIDCGISLFTCNKMAKRYPEILSGLSEKAGDIFVPDDFRHEQYLLIEEEGKKVLISGCSHKGILDIASWFSADVIVGGFHFSKLALDEKLISMAQTLARHKTKFYTCHCTGVDQFEFMKKDMPSLKYLSCGETIII